MLHVSIYCKCVYVCVPQMIVGEGREINEFVVDGTEAGNEEL